MALLAMYGLAALQRHGSLLLRAAARTPISARRAFRRWRNSAGRRVLVNEIVYVQLLVTGR